MAPADGLDSAVAAVGRPPLDGAPYAVECREVSKTYMIDPSPRDRLRRLLGLSSRSRPVRALDHVDLELPTGAAMGIVGENGAGKSTLLKIVSGTTAPTSGSVRVEGITASILELGAAFHPEFSGRDNAILYGSLLGIDSEALHQRLPRMHEFSELGEFLEHPVKSYSTGMAMRLAFAVATHVDADVLIIDEALAVGDGYFQKKCIDRLMEIKRRGTTILFCSHSMYAVTMFCDQALWLRDGTTAAMGPVHGVVDAYESFLLTRGKRVMGAERDHLPPEVPRAGKIGRIAGVEVLHASRGTRGLQSDEELAVVVDILSTDPRQPLHVGVSLDTVDGKCLAAAATFLSGVEPLQGRRRYRVRLGLQHLGLANGSLSVYAYLLDDTGLCIHDEVVVPSAVRVDRERWHPALLEVEHRWTVERADETVDG